VYQFQNESIKERTIHYQWIKLKAHVCERILESKTSTMKT